MNGQERQATNGIIIIFFSWKWLLCFPVSHWLEFNDSVLVSAYETDPLKTTQNAVVHIPGL